MTRPIFALCALMTVSLTSLVASTAAHAAHRATDGRCHSAPFVHAHDGWCYAIDWWNHTAADDGPAYPDVRRNTRHEQWCKATYPRYNPRNNTWIDEYGSLHISMSRYY